MFLYLLHSILLEDTHTHTLYIRFLKTALYSQRDNFTSVCRGRGGVMEDLLRLGVLCA